MGPEIADFAQPEKVDEPPQAAPDMFSVSEI
jgi:hypothetical protein